MMEGRGDKKSLLYRWLAVVFIVIIVSGFGMLALTRYLISQGESGSTVGKAWLDLQTRPDSDLDEDGLSNEEEDIYNTDFWVADTDGDGFSDGLEVKNGYNPAGDGRLDDVGVTLDFGIFE